MGSDVAEVDLRCIVREHLNKAKSSLPPDQELGFTLNAINVLLYLLDVVVAVADWCMTDDGDVERLWKENRFSDVSDVLRLTQYQALLREIHDHLKKSSEELRTLVHKAGLREVRLYGEAVATACPGVSSVADKH
ncbi:hypothetical protein CDEST_02088 [Colletotrichum destructivum]|uniref:Uncharacterized protein n=1 Tax=Colletotrichum destructivum TaxID=34406 RepID=A0AAX4I144_9PEZI|nr:hypothetical protein CDEST_02088 [Colletotrichum destructivum]